VLEESEVAARAQHACQLGQVPRRVGDAAQDTRNDGTVHRFVVGGQTFARSIDHTDRHGRDPRGVERDRPKVGLRFDREQLHHC
jgi:hypothetical protein